MNVRLWVTHRDSPVKLTLNEDSYLEYGCLDRHDEGFTSSHTTLEIIENYVFMKVYVDSSDCDGRYRDDTTYEVPVSSLNKTIDAEGKRIYPKWKRVEGSHRDFSAEAAGY